MPYMINYLLDDDDWDENTVQSYFVKYVSLSEKLYHTTPFSKARKLLVNFPVGDNGNCDSYINYSITCAVNIYNSF